MGDCLTDAFVVGGGGKSSPVICGTNTGQHGIRFNSFLNYSINSASFFILVFVDSDGMSWCVLSTPF